MRSFEPKAGLRDVNLIALLCMLLLLSVALIGADGTTDVPHALPWIDLIEHFGLRNGFIAFHGDYPPLSSAIMSVSYRLLHPLGATPFWAFKLSLLAFLCATAALFYAWRRDLAAAIGLFAAFLVSIVLGYMDIYDALPIVGALWALKSGRIALASFLAVIATAIKWQPLILFPFVVVYLMKIEGPRLQTLWHAFWPLALTASALILFYGYDSLAGPLAQAMGHSALSGNALNFNWLLQYYLERTHPGLVGDLFHGMDKAGGVDPALHYLLSSRYIFYAFYGVTLAAFAFDKTSFQNFLLYAALGYLAYCVFNVGVHENHWFLAALLLLVLAAENRTYCTAALCVTAISNINLLLFYGLTGHGLGFVKAEDGFDISRMILGFDITLPVALLFTLYFSLLWSQELFFRARN